MNPMKNNGSKRFPRTGRLASRRSFNLVELSLAIAVVAVGVVSVFGILPHLLQSSRLAADFSAISLDVQRVLEDQNHRGMITLYELADTSLFPDPGAPRYITNNYQSFKGKRYECAMPATNADFSMAAANTNFFDRGSGRYLLKTVFMTYNWGATESASNRNTYTFITETAVTQGFLSP